MSEQKLRKKRIESNLKFDKLPSKLGLLDSEMLGAAVSNFIYYVFLQRQKSLPLNWVFTNIKRAKIFLQIFHANQSGSEIYKEEIAKRLSEYSYKTIATIIDEGLSKGVFVSLEPKIKKIKDKKVKNIRPSEEVTAAFINWNISRISSAHNIFKKYR